MPPRYNRSPNRYLLRRGTPLWRVHHAPYGAWEFKAKPSDMLYGGGRFDATEADRYPYLYAGLSAVTALGETLLRDVASDESGYRVVPNKEAAGRTISELTLAQDLHMVSVIDAEDLGAIGQDDWLVSCSGHDYPYTRDWGHWLRRKATWAHGFIWDSKRDRGGLAIVVFGDRLARDFGYEHEQTLPREITEGAADLGDATGSAWANERLIRFHAIVSPPVALPVATRSSLILCLRALLGAASVCYPPVT